MDRHECASCSDANQAIYGMLCAQYNLNLNTECQQYNYAKANKLNNKTTIRPSLSAARLCPLSSPRHRIHRQP